jgi:hypothetical protein
LIGNFHKAVIMPRYRNVFAVQLPSFQAQTGWMASQSLVSEVAGIILDIGLHPKGIAPVAKVEVVSFYEPLADDWP